MFPIEDAVRVRCAMRDCPGDLGWIILAAPGVTMYLAPRGFVADEKGRYRKASRNVARRPHSAQGDWKGNLPPRSLPGETIGLSESGPIDVVCPMCAFGRVLVICEDDLSRALS